MLLMKQVLIFLILAVLVHVHPVLVKLSQVLLTKVINLSWMMIKWMQDLSLPVLLIPQVTV